MQNLYLKEEELGHDEPDRDVHMQKPMDLTSPASSLLTVGMRPEGGPFPRNACTSILQSPDNCTKKKSHASEYQNLYIQALWCTETASGLELDVRSFAFG
jgi:hypothetical protein